MLAVTLLHLLLAAAAVPPAPCSLESGAEEIAAAVERRKTARRLSLPKAERDLWSRHPWQGACAPVAAAWLADPDEVKRIAAAAWFWEVRTETHENRVYIPIVSELFNFHSVRARSSRKLPLSPEVLDAFVARAGAETVPLVLRVQVEQLMELGELERARAAVRAGLKLVARDEDLLGYAFALWNQPRAPELSKPERDLVWSLRVGERSALARSVLSLQRDERWIAYLKANLTPANYEAASLAGLSPLFSKKVIAGVRSKLARKERCFSFATVPLQLRGAKAEEILALAEALLGCADQLSSAWDSLLVAGAWSPEAPAALSGLVRLQGEKGEAAFWRYGSSAIVKAATLRTDEAIEPMLEVLRVSTTPREGESRSTWRFADDVLVELGKLGTAAAAEAVLEVARICAGPCEGSGRDCLWRMRDKARHALATIGGPDLARRRAELDALRPAPVPVPVPAPDAGVAADAN